MRWRRRRPSPSPIPDRGRLAAALQQALDAALSGLEPQDRLRLAYYHVDEMTLAQIGRQLGEHEATVSRKLTRIRQTLRERIDAALRDELRLGPEEIRACYRQALEDGTVSARGLRLVVSAEENPTRPAGSGAVPGRGSGEPVDRTAGRNRGAAGRAARIDS